MTRKRTVALVALCAVVGLAGCSSSDADDEVKPAASTSASAAPTQAPAATGDQWASLIAQGKSGAVDALQSWEDSGCLATMMDTACAITLTTMGYAAGTLSTLIEAGTNEAGSGYIGAPPAEISALVDETKAAADRAAEAASAAGTACTGGAECTTEAFAAVVAYDSLTSSLAGWAPYGG